MGPTRALAALFLTLLVFSLPATHSEQNGDLVFDDMGLDDSMDDENSHLHHMLEAEDVMMQEPSTFGRMRSMVMGWFGGRGADDDANAVDDEVAPHRVRRSIGKLDGVKGKRRRIRKKAATQPVDDDEDDSSGVDVPDVVDGFKDIASGEGRPHTRPPHHSSGKPYFNRVSFQIEEVYQPDWADRNSNQFKVLSKSITQDVTDMYKNAYRNDDGRFMANVLAIERVQGDNFRVRVRMDIGSDNYHPTEEMKQKLINHIKNTGKLGGSTAFYDNNFSFRSVQECKPEQFSCTDSQCLPSNVRCNGQFECSDRSDEEGCPEQCGTEEFQCDGNRCLSLNQKCDNKIDCADQSDELDCNEPTPSSCKANEFNCGDQCIEGNLKCNGIPECTNGADEVGCPAAVTTTQQPSSTTPRGFTTGPASCAANEVQCRDRTCVRGAKCDGRVDCADNSDEDGCQPRCTPDQFRCSDGSCHDPNIRCNGRMECSNGEDEDNCRKPCLASEFTCSSSGRCISLVSKCDGRPDCSDGSDEENCGCQSNEFRCADGTCINESYKCDGYEDCLDRSDETNCKQSCLTSEFTCADGTCIPASYKCNRARDCTDGSDEQNCPALCSPLELTCRDGSCVDRRRQCDGRRDCLDGSDEERCPTTTTARPCGADEMTCSDGSCVNYSLRCDGRYDCADGRDEQGCPPITTARPFPGCRSDQFTCRNRECVSRDAKCNGRYDCRDGSDEEECPTPPPQGINCGRDEFTCNSKDQCVPRSLVCDGKYDCNDYSDETNSDCRPPSPTSPFDDRIVLKTYPDDQIIKTGREVVFQCRDEGPRRTQVKWSRSGGALPPGSRDVNGRLEMPNIKMDHSGTYSCQALGVSPNTPGARKDVILQVESHHTVNSTIRPPSACRLEEATCGNGQCIPKFNVCDGRMDCTDGTDESRCAGRDGCEPNQFKCRNKKCTLKTWRCDGEDDCGDNSDEENCVDNPPGSQCRYNEFQCRSGNQCVPKSFHCDGQNDCLDGTDEFGCSPPFIQVPPTPMVVLDVGAVFIITCTAIGVPTPEVNWRLNWGHVPEKCTQVSENGVGRLECRNIEFKDQGAYSCEAINAKGSTFAVPDSILVVNREPSPCRQGTFNDVAILPSDCLSCFCFGATTDCKSANLFTYQLPPPIGTLKVMGVSMDGRVSVSRDFDLGSANLRTIPQGFQIYGSIPRNRNVHPYLALSENFHGNQLKSYGGYIKHSIRSDIRGRDSRPINSPSIIISGNGKMLMHPSKRINPGDNEVSVRIFYGEWYKVSDARPGGDIPADPSELATRAEIMMVLADVDHILIKIQYTESSQIDTSVFNFKMDSAAVNNVNQGQASFVEECRCPDGYSGLSCENCAPGFVRRQGGSWLGNCVKDVPQDCPAGSYGDPSRNIACQPCACPLTGAQFGGTTCRLDTDGQQTCNCPVGYQGRRCEQCSSGYSGNPLRGQPCTIVSRPTCDVAGSLNPNPDPYTGQCQCKEFVTGPTCNQCKANSFFLHENHQFGCVRCFCMGIEATCHSSNLYREQLSLAFTSNTQDVKLVEGTRQDTIISEGIQLNPQSREIVYNNFNPRFTEVFYWRLPSRFVGDKVTAYGGFLNYTVRYDPAPGGQSSRNNAYDVELRSSKTNDITLLYYAKDIVQPNRPQTVSVPLYEQYWQRTDGQPADREHMLMTLANLDYINIKATYTTNTREAALISVSMDIAEDRNTGQSRAFAVEECACPQGYRGLSCQNCAVGYTRADEGIYLGKCELCECNGHSSECDSETGDCRNCRDFTAGPNCDECVRGYTMNANDQCEPDQTGPPEDQRNCDQCDSKGLSSCRNGICECKTNVEGQRCDRCRAGSFDLSKSHPSGCLECFCSGVSQECQSSSLYPNLIPMQILEEDHGFTLTDSERREFFKDGLSLDPAKNEIGYVFDGRHAGRRLFWSLPSAFTGNKVQSYGGVLTISQRYSGSSGQPDQDVLLIGNGKTLYWSNYNNPIQPDEDKTYAVPLSESSWMLNSRNGPVPASRMDMMTVLADVEMLLVRASLGANTRSTYLSDVTMEIALDANIFPGQITASQVEMCRCPSGYRGMSCERCDVGHYRDTSDMSTSMLGVCRKCPCNNNEESCSQTPDLRVTCNCKPGFSGRNCDNVGGPISGGGGVIPTPGGTSPPATISISISEPSIQIVQVGSEVRFKCSGRSLKSRTPVRLAWQKEGDSLPQSRSRDDGQGILVITDVRTSDSGTYLCVASDEYSVVSERAVLTVGGSVTQPPQATINPRFQEVQEQQLVEFRCAVTGSPVPTIRWTTANGRPLNPSWVYNGEVLRIPAARRNDEGEYICTASNSAGTDSASAFLYVKERSQPDPRPPVVDSIRVEPREAQAHPGETVRLLCSVPLAGYTLRWSRMGGEPLPISASDRSGQLIISNVSPADSGVYVCVATDNQGRTQQFQARVTIVTQRSPPSVRVEPDRQTIAQGTSGELRCVATGDPAPTVAWTKVNDDMGRSVQITGNTLRIPSALVSDRGVYACTATSHGGESAAYAMIEVERREAPTVEMYPAADQIVTSGSGVLLQCRVTGGIPAPTLVWKRTDGRPMSPKIELHQGGVFSVSDVSASEAGQYQCVVENTVGSISATASIIVQSLPVIKGLSTEPRTVQVGQSIRLDCRAEGDPTPNVVWKRHRLGPANYYNLGEITPERPQNAVYEISRATREDEGSYSCVATNAAGVSEERVQIIVEQQVSEIFPSRRPPQGGSQGGGENYPQPTRGYPAYTTPLYTRNDYPTQSYLPGTIRTNSERMSVNTGGMVELRCYVQNNREQIFLNWVRTDNLPMPRDYDIQDGVLTIRKVEREAAGNYACTGMLNGREVFRANAYLEVNEQVRIQLNPNRQVVRPGDNALITCEATGEQPISITWQRLRGPMPRSVQTSGGRLQFQGIAVSDAGRYICSAINRHGSANATAEVIVEDSIPTPYVRASQQVVSTLVGSNVALRCDSPAQVEWRHNSRDLSPMAYVQNNVLTINNVQLEDAGRYICSVRSPQGDTQDFIDLNVTPARNNPVQFRPRPSDIKIEASQERIALSDTVDLQCKSSAPGAAITWSKVDDDLANNIQVQAGFLRINNVRSTNGGRYRCTVRTAQGEKYEDYSLAIAGSTAIERTPYVPPHTGVRHDDIDTIDHPTPSSEPSVVTKTSAFGTSVEFECRSTLENGRATWTRQNGVLPEKAYIRGDTLVIPEVDSSDAGTYLCTAVSPLGNQVVPTVLLVTGLVPYFGQSPNSYMALPTLTDAYSTFSIEVSFKPENPDGLILYNGQQLGGSGDFLSFGLNGGVPEFRFSTGHSPVIIRGNRPLKIGQWHTAKLMRINREGSMKIDGGDAFVGIEQGRFQGLDLQDSLYVAGVPDYNNINKQSGFTKGFVGCVGKLSLGSKQIDLMKEALVKEGVTLCETCAESQCVNNGVCQEAYAEQGYKCICPSGFTGVNCEFQGEVCYPGACGSGRCEERDGSIECMCPLGYEGRKCDKEIKITEPMFNQNSWISYPKPRAVLKMDVDIKFKPKELSDGVLLYSAQSKDGAGDFIAIVVKDEKVELRYDMGSGVATVRSDKVLKPGKWHHVKVTRGPQTSGSISVDNEELVTGRSPGNKRGLNLGTMLYLGGWDQSEVTLSPRVGVNTGFSGCVSKLNVTAMRLDVIKSAVGSSNVAQCSVDNPCDSSPCLQDARCEDHSNDYVCYCPAGFSGKNCEEEDNLCNTQAYCQNDGVCVGTANSYKCNCPKGFGGLNCESRVEFDEEVGFEGDGYVELLRDLLPHTASNKDEMIEVEFTTSSANGLIFWHGQSPDVDGRKSEGRYHDYLSLAVVDGFLEFGWELGSGPGKVVSRTKVDDGQRHRVRAWRQANNGSLVIDDQDAVVDVSQGTLKLLNTNGNIYIGGLPKVQYMTGGRYSESFNGCIHSVHLNDSGSLNLYDRAVISVNAQKCASSGGKDDSTTTSSIEVDDSDYDDDKDLSLALNRAY